MDTDTFGEIIEVLRSVGRHDIVNRLLILENNLIDDEYVLEEDQEIISDNEYSFSSEGEDEEIIMIEGDDGHCYLL